MTAVHPEVTTPPPPPAPHGRSLSLAPNVTGSDQNCKVQGRQNRLTINVGGIRYETYKSTLKNIPDTRLSWITETTSQNADFDPLTGEYFFDRHPGVFNMVLNYYRTGKLHAPTDVCGPLFEEELAFWGIDEKQIEPCCWMSYRTHRDAQQTLAELEGEDLEAQGDNDDDDGGIAVRFGIEEDAGPPPSRWQKLKQKTWILLDEPYSSKAAQVIAIVSLVFVILSISTFVLETHPTLRVALNESDPINKNWTIYEKNIKSKPHDAILILEFICVAFFTVEFVLRLVVCPNKKAFFKVPLTWVDLFSIVPFYSEKIIILIRPTLEYSIALQVLKAIRLIRIFRIFKLTRHFSGLKILVHTIKASAKELMLLILFLIISVLIFASIIYYAESVDELEVNDFKNIPIGFWWSLVTMTTLGYGDMYPRTGLGYVVGGICAVVGVLVLALPVPVIVNNFALYYSHAQAKAKLPKKRKTALYGAADLLKTQQSLPGFTSISEQFVSSPSPSPSYDSSHLTLAQTASSHSVDSGLKMTSVSGSPSCPSTGISVIFTDEFCDTPSTKNFDYSLSKSLNRDDKRKSYTRKHREEAMFKTDGDEDWWKILKSQSVPSNLNSSVNDEPTKAAQLNEEVHHNVTSQLHIIDIDNGLPTVS